MSIEGLVRWHKCEPSPLDIAWAREKWSDPVAVVEKLEQSPMWFWGGTDKVAVCAVLGACLIQAQEHAEVLETELCCLGGEWTCEKEQTCPLLKLLLAQRKTAPSAARTEKLTRGADPDGSDEDTWTDKSGNSSDEMERLEEKAV